MIAVKVINAKKIVIKKNWFRGEAGISTTPEEKQGLELVQKRSKD